MAITFKSWDSPASGNWGGRIKKAYGSTSARLTSWKDLDWVSLGIDCEVAYQIALAEVKEELQAEYEAFLAAKARVKEAMNPEGGAYEGNLSDEYPMPQMTLEEVQHIKQKAASSVVTHFCEVNNLKSLGVQLMQQLITYIGSFKLTTTDGEDYCGDTSTLISAKALYKQIFATAEGKGLHYFLMHDNRSDYLETQYKGTAKNFCALVPIVLYAFKLIKGIPYSRWYKPELRGIVNPKLVDAMLWDENKYPKPDKSTLIEARVDGLLVKTGSKAGQTRNPVYTFKLYGKSCISSLPDYVQVMYTQIWCAHPENRTKYMVLDPSNWDTMPPPLVDTEIVVEDIKPTKPPIKFERKVSAEDLAW